MRIKLLLLVLMLGSAAGCSKPAPAPDWSALIMIASLAADR